jgi:hypothetical protein
MTARGLGSASSQRNEKNRLPPFVPLLITTLDSPAWKVLSHGAARLYVALRRRVPKARNRAFLSYRQAAAEVRASHSKIAEWFRELEHYGLIVLDQPGYLGVEGKGRAPHWRLTELGHAGQENPTNDFQQWNGVPFKRTGDRREARFLAFLKKQNPATGVSNGVLPASVTPPLPASVTPRTESATGGVDIGTEDAATGVESITSLPLPGAPGPDILPELPAFLDRRKSRSVDSGDDPLSAALNRWGAAVQRDTK